ncbi:MAG: DUF362 domain-containing protein, partial [Bacteroidota bacterium]
MVRKKKTFERRDYLKGIGLGAIGGIAFGSEILYGRGLTSLNTPQDRAGHLYKKLTEPARVSLVKGNDRHEIVYQSLKMIEDEVLGSIGNKTIVIKPNIVLSNCPLGVTHADAVRAVLDFLTPHHKKQIIIGESGVQNTLEGFKNYGYFKLEQEYNVKVVDLNQDSYQYRYVFGKGNQPQPVRIVSTLLDPNIYLISVARMKTHDCVLVTLSLKNVLLGCPLNDYKRNDKGFMHGAVTAVNDALHFNMFHVAQEVYPDLAVIDGFEAMEGNGPARGTPFDSRVALASRDALAADIIATKIMGFDPKRILYLSVMADAGMGQGEIEKINVLGTPLSQCLYKFKPHDEMARLY